jgi:hypothetical protein
VLIFIQQCYTKQKIGCSQEVLAARVVNAVTLKRIIQAVNNVLSLLETLMTGVFAVGLTI